ncbi:MAG: hypothetical protein FWE15_10795 [Actinomycetia bacterium]|nr:hypothetical protein [Actinomycetes bacterium]MCL2730496.1 hypothetical protein [Actinomycetes bacterium]
MSGGRCLLGVVNDETPICSAKDCRAPAVWVLAWNNPKLHTPDRRKTWLACDEHREHLSSFLGMRGFLKDVVTLEQWERSAARDTATGRDASAGHDTSPGQDGSAADR